MPTIESSSVSSAVTPTSSDMLAAVEQGKCYHCGLPAFSEFSAELQGQRQSFCCLGCQAVSQAICDGGLADYYRYRDQQAQKVERQELGFEAFDESSVQQSFVYEQGGGVQRVALHIGGISCAACAWLIEKHLSHLHGVTDVRVNVASHRLSFLWQAELIKLSDVFKALVHIGYKPSPASDSQGAKLRSLEKRSALLRLGVAGLGMMQVGMVGIALHAGSAQGIDAGMQFLLRWVSLIFALPVMLYSAQSFFIGALRSLRLKHLNMDVPVSLALSLAFLASLVATITNRGEVYYDSVSMFTFFLLVGRFLEMRARHVSAAETEKLTSLLPLSVERIESDGKRSFVPLASLEVGDHLSIRAGDVVPCDGQLLSALAMFDEALLTGESELQKRKQGDLILAGSVLAEPSLTMRVTAKGQNTKLASVQQLLEEALSQKPKQQQLADKVAGYFVAAVLLVCASVFTAWYFIDSSRAFWVALSVLVVTCPCALSLATPAALSAGLNKLRVKGLLLVSAGALECLPRIKHIVLDKTGTLTMGEPQVAEIQVLTELSHKQIMSLIASMEQHSRHPIARAFSKVPITLTAERVNIAPGQGIEAFILGCHYRFGRADYAIPDQVLAEPSEGQWQLLACEGQAIAWLRFEDQLRPGLAGFISFIKQQELKASLLSGDKQKNVDDFVEKNLSGLKLECALGELKPEGKLAHMKAIRQQAHANAEPLLMMGDGINDAPVLASADLSIAMASSSQFTRVNADSVLLNSNLTVVSEAILFSAKVKRVIQQNFAWALAYNLVALPAAAMGYVAPWLAAIGMSLSSLVVIFNSLRLSR